MGAAGDRLRDYRSKRDFGRTSEPSGEGAGKDRGTSAEHPLFVVQEHAASTRHFDLRLEVDGVLKSWAVPKGPSTDPSEKRLAVPTEDHPLEYADYEGVIPEDQYGAGAVIVWDRGTYRSLKEDGAEAEDDDEGEGAEEPPSMAETLADGHATVWLEGKKLRGGYALIRIEDADAWEDQRWLLVKMDDDEADARRNPVSTEPKSVLSGRTVEEVAAEGETKEP